MNMLGVILARAGSVGLPSKHLQMLIGRSVVEYTIDYAMDSHRLTRVVASTDCPGVKRISAVRGVAVIDRPPELATADASVQGAMLHALHACEARWSVRFDGVVVLYGNVPVRPEGAIDRAIELLQKTGCDSVRSFCPLGKWHPAWMARLDGDRVESLQPGSIHRRQDLTPLFLHDGAVVAVARASMLRGESSPDDPHAFFGEDRRGIEVGAEQTVEIDSLRDLYWAEAVLRSRRQQSEAA
jgi:CMP-N,N'-diacetyllegionaminic acid synthase